MEEVYARIPRTNIPGVFLREIGGGRVVLFPMGSGPYILGGARDVDHGKLLRMPLLWA